VCKILTTYIFSLYLKSPQTWYNLFPSTSSILLVLFISSLLTFMPVVFFSFFILFYSFVLWKVWRFLENISHFCLDFLKFKKREIPKFSNFFFVAKRRKFPSKNVLWRSTWLPTRSKFPTYFADHSRKGRRRAIAQVSPIRATHPAPFLLGI
jgi:hypothetical protein